MSTGSSSPGASTVNRYCSILSHEAILLQQKQALGEMSLDTISTMRKLAELYCKGGDLDKAISLCEECLMKTNLVFGDRFPATLSTLFNLAIYYFAKGDVEKALSLQEDCFDKRKQVLGESHKDTLKCTEAITLIKVKQKDNTVKTNKPEDICSSAKPIESLFSNMKIKELIELIDKRKLNRVGLYDRSELVQLLESSPSPTSHPIDMTRTDKEPDIATKNQLAKLHQDASTHFKNGNLKVAKEMFARCLEGREGALGSNHEDTLTTVYYIGQLLNSQRNFREAKLMFERSTKGFGVALGPDNKLTLESTSHLGGTLHALGQRVEAIVFLERALGGYERTLGVDHETTLSIVSNLGDVFKALGNIRKTRLMWEGAYEGYKRTLGPTHPLTIELKQDLVELSIEIGMLNANRGRAPVTLSSKSGNIPNEVFRGLQDSTVATSIHGDDSVELRGVKLQLLQAVRKYALSKNSDPKHWSLGRVSALIVGNTEILSLPCRFGDLIDPRTTLTFADGEDDGKCSSSLIDTLKRDNFRENNKHPFLNVSYEEVVGANANVFLSFAYEDNFFELVEALEQLSTKNPLEFNKDSTFYWFDMFVNNQWLGPVKSADWWQMLFRDAIQKIGHTLCFLSPWNDPVLVKKAWCLYEMSCSKKLTMLLSPKQTTDFQNNFRSRNFRTQDSSTAMFEILGKINIEKATCRKEEDRLQIFAAVRATPGGFSVFNNQVVGHIRDWIISATKAMIDDHTDKVCEHELDEWDRNFDQAGECLETGVLLMGQDRLDEAKPLVERALRGFQKVVGPNDPSTLSAVHNLARILDLQGHVEEARALYEKNLQARERILGRNDQKTLISLNCLAGLLYNQCRYDEARPLWERVLRTREKVLGAAHPDTLNSANLLSMLLLKISQEAYKKGNVEEMNSLVLEANALSERAFRDSERVLGVDNHVRMEIVNHRAYILMGCKQYDIASPILENALRTSERVFGPHHSKTDCLRNSLEICKKNLKS